MCVCVCLAKSGVGMVTISTTCTTSFIHNRFILQDLDELHIFVSSDVAKLLQQKIDELMEKNSYSEFDQLKVQYIMHIASEYTTVLT